MNKRIFISAGEVSGDLQGSLLVSQIKKLDPSIEFYGFGGRFLEDASVKIIHDFTHRSSVGFIESIPYIFDHYSIMRNFIEYLKKEENKPDLCILIDNQGFNLELGKRLKKLNIPTVYYFPPPISIWGKFNAKKIVKSIDYFLVPFFADYQEYLKFTEKVYFFGHPFFDKEYLEEKLQEKPPENAYYDSYYFMLPGSRMQEISTLLPMFLEVADYIYNKYSISAYLPVANMQFEPYIREMVGGRKHVMMLDKCYYSLYKNARFALMASGSATLEALLLNIPHIICYKVSPLTFFIGKLMVKTNHVGMSNILAGEEIAPELLQRKCNVKEMEKRVEQLFDPEFRLRVVQKLSRVSSELSGINKSSSLVNYAKTILDILQKLDEKKENL
ncbi:MAG TPA: lipid-A-disaccharide synthase [Exilispira sp.]|nr:lipid-A-disaccharide synthase [Exilispira sp.]